MGVGGAAPELVAKLFGRATMSALSWQIAFVRAITVPARVRSPRGRTVRRHDENIGCPAGLRHAMTGVAEHSVTQKPEARAPGVRYRMPTLDHVNALTSAAGVKPVPSATDPQHLPGLLADSRQTP